MKKKQNLLFIGILLGLAVFFPIAILGLLYYGYKLAFYYKDPQNSPYDYEDTDQSRSCKEILDSAITEFKAAPFESVSIKSHDGLELCGRYYHVKDHAPLEIQYHGYKGNAIRDFSGNWKIANEAGRNVLLIDERCHGNSEGHTISVGI